MTYTAPEEKVSSAARLEYMGSNPIAVRGPATGRAYVFDPGSRVEIDARDADALRRTHLFR